MRAYLSILFVLVLPAALAAEPEKTPKDATPAPRAQNLLDAMDKAAPAAGTESLADRKLRAVAHYDTGKKL